MLKSILVLSAVTSLLVGCSSTPPQTTAEPYCYTDETIVNDNGNVNSKTVLQCSDDPLKRAKLVGVDPLNCRRWERQDTINGNIKTYGGYICRDAKNNWRPLSSF